MLFKKLTKTSKYPQKEPINFQQALNLPSSNTLKPYFDFQYIDRKTIKKIEKKEWEQFTKRLRRLKDRTWDEINSSPKEQYGYESIPIKSLKKIPSHPFKEEENIYVFRYSQKGRFLGYKVSDVFYIIKVDPNHEYDK